MTKFSLAGLWGKWNILMRWFKHLKAVWSLMSNSAQKDCRKTILTWTPGMYFLWAKQSAVQRKLEPVCESNTSGAGTTFEFILKYWNRFRMPCTWGYMTSYHIKVICKSHRMKASVKSKCYFQHHRALHNNSLPV